MFASLARVSASSEATKLQLLCLRSHRCSLGEAGRILCAIKQTSATTSAAFLVQTFFTSECLSVCAASLFLTVQQSCSILCRVVWAPRNPNPVLDEKIVWPLCDFRMQFCQELSGLGRGRSCMACITDARLAASGGGNTRRSR